MPELWGAQGQARQHLDMAMRKVQCEVRGGGLLSLDARRSDRGPDKGGELMLKCTECGRLVEKLPEGRVRCPHCGSRILFKARQEVVRKVKAK